MENLGLCTRSFIFYFSISYLRPDKRGVQASVFLPRVFIIAKLSGQKWLYLGDIFDNIQLFSVRHTHPTKEHFNLHWLGVRLNYFGKYPKGRRLASYLCEHVLGIELSSKRLHGVKWSACLRDIMYLSHAINIMYSTWPLVFKILLVIIDLFLCIFGFESWVLNQKKVNFVLSYGVQGFCHCLSGCPAAELIPGHQMWQCLLVIKSNMGIQTPIKFSNAAGFRWEKHSYNTLFLTKKSASPQSVYTHIKNV